LALPVISSSTRGVKYPPTNLLTVDGYDLQFGTNALGHYFFTILLLPTLIATAKGSPDGHARVINTSTVGHFFAGGIDWKSLKAGPERDKLTTEALYYQSKLVELLFDLRKIGTYTTL
jgi:retinol dehydrogenase-12